MKPLPMVEIRMTSAGPVAYAPGALATWLTLAEACGLLDVSAETIASLEQRGRLRPGRDRRLTADGERYVTVYDPDELAKVPLANRGCSALDDFCIGPGVVTLPEFRRRYGYVCKRHKCVLCGRLHARGRGRACGSSGEASGTRYRVYRADASAVCDGASATTAWKAALRVEAERLAPILIARDALAEGRLAEARRIADQLSPDLAEPLRREIARKTEETGCHPDVEMDASARDRAYADVYAETNRRFWKRTQYKPGRRLDMADPEDRKRASTWVEVFREVQRDTRYKDAPRFACGACGHHHLFWAARCHNCLSHGLARVDQGAP